MVSVNINNNKSKGGGFLLFVSIILMVSGLAIEYSGYDVALGALLFTIGFWLFIIPLILIGVVLATILVIAIIASR